MFSCIKRSRRNLVNTEIRLSYSTQETILDLWNQTKRTHILKAQERTDDARPLGQKAKNEEQQSLKLIQST